MRTIYADILLAINLAVDYLVLFGTARLAGVRFERIKGLAAAIIGAVYSLIIIFDFSKTFLLLSKFAVSAIMVSVSFGKRKIGEYIRLVIIFYICTFLFSGFMMLIDSFAETNEFFVKNGIVYFEFSAWEIVFSAAAAFIITEILRRFFRNKEPDGTFIARITYENKTAVLKCFTDTGNELEEPFTGTPVAVASMESLKSIIPKKMSEIIINSEMSTEYKIKLVPCKTISGIVLMPAFSPDKVIFENSQGKYEAEEIIIGVSGYAPEKTLIIGKNALLKEIK